MSQIGYSTLAVLPSSKGFSKALSSQINPGMKSAGSEGGKHYGGGMLAGARKFVAPLAGLFAAKLGVDFLKDAVGGASDLGESASKVGVVFGKQFAPQIVAASKSAAKSMGLSQNAYLAATGGLGNLLVSLKIAPKAAAGMSQSMVKLAGDLASFNNVAPEEALAALQSGLTGETEPLKRFGVNMNDATLKAQALKMGLIKSTKEALSPQTKALAAQALIMAQTGTAQGDFARTSGGLANQQRILAAQTEDLKTKIGSAFLPVVTKVVTFFNANLIPAFTILQGGVRALVEAFKAGGSDITSAGFAGIMERIGLGARALYDGFNTNVLPVLKTVATFITGSIVPALQTFFSFLNGNDTGVDGPFRQMAVAGETLRAFITDKLIPAFKGIKGYITDTMTPAVKDFATVVAIPALLTLAAYLTGTLIPAIDSFATSLNDHRTSILGAAGAITAVFIPALIKLAITATISGAETIAIWAMLQASAVASTVASVAAFIVQGAKWVWMGHVAMISAAKIALAWVVAAGPIAIVIAAVVGLGVLIWKNMDNIKGWIGAAWNWIKATTRTVWGAISGFFTDLWDSITGGISSAWASVTSFVSGVWSAITGFVAKIAAVALQLLDWWTYPYRIGTAIVIGLVLLFVNAVMVPINWLITSVVAGWNLMWAFTASIFSTVKTFVVGVWVAIVGFVVPIVARMVANLVANFTRIWNVAVSIFGAVRGFLTGVWNGIFAVVSGVAGRIWGAVSGAFNRVSGVVGSVMGTVKGVVSSAWDTIWGKISGVTGRISAAVSGAFNSIKDTISGAIGSAVGAASSLASKVIEAIKSGLGKIASIGGDIVSGLINGITGAGGRLRSAITDFIAKNVPEPVRKVLGIESPSKVFADLGRNTVQGFIVGIDDKSSALESSMRSLVMVPGAGSMDFASSAARAAAVGGGGGPTVVNVYVNGQVYGSTREMGRVVLAGLQDLQGAGVKLGLNS